MSSLRTTLDSSLTTPGNTTKIKDEVVETSFHECISETSFVPADAESKSLKDRQVTFLTRPREKKSKKVDKPEFACKNKLKKCSVTVPIRVILATGEYIGWAGKWIGKNFWDSRKVEKQEFKCKKSLEKSIATAPKKSIATAPIRAILTAGEYIVYAGKCLQTPAPIYNQMPFRARDFVETTTQEDEDFSKNLNEALDHYLKEYNKDKEHDYEKIDKKDIVKKVIYFHKTNDGKVNLKKPISFRIIFRKKDINGYILDKNGNYTYDLKYLFQEKIDEIVDYDHTLLKALNVFNNFDYLADKSDSEQNLRKTYKTGVEYLETKNISYETKKSEVKTTNNCWLESSLQAFLHDDNLLNKVIQLNKALEVKINENYETYKKANKNTSITLETFKQSAKFNEKYGTMILVQCFLESIGKSLNEQNKIIEKYAADIRKHCLSKATMNSQEDATELLFFLINELAKNNIIPTYNMTSVKHLKEDAHKEDAELETCIYNYSDQINSYITINLSYYPDAISEDPKLDISEVINGVAKKEEKITDYDPGTGTGKKDWIVEKEENPYYFDIKPEDGIALYFSRFNQQKGSEIKHETKLINIPEGFSFKDHRFNPQNSRSTSEYQIKYALIHNGSLNSGHYYTLCREDDKWYTYNGSIEEEITDENKRKEILENAVYIHYEKISS